MSIRYRILQKQDVVGDGFFNYEAAYELFVQLKDTYPDKEYEIEKYQYISPEGKLFGRDPDLH